MTLCMLAALPEEHGINRTRIDELMGTVRTMAPRTWLCWPETLYHKASQQSSLPWPAARMVWRMVRQFD